MPVRYTYQLSHWSSGRQFTARNPPASLNTGCSGMMLSLLTYTGAIREKLKWADGKLVKEAIEREVLTVV